jgi:hypothetical protein
MASNTKPEKKTPAIEGAVALVLYVVPALPHLAGAHDALSAFEHKHFAPGTPAADLYQVAIDPTWNNMILSVVVFPGRHLAEFAESLRAHGLALVRGTPTMFGAAGHDCYDPAAILRKIGVEIGDRTFVFEKLSASGKVLREGVTLDELTKK